MFATLLLLIALMLLASAWQATPPDPQPFSETTVATVYLFACPTDPTQVVLAMNIHPQVALPRGETIQFASGTCYQFLLRAPEAALGTGERLIQIQFFGSGPDQQVWVTGPADSHDAEAGRLSPHGVFGTINRAFSPTPGMLVFAGEREDPFFFDLNQLFPMPGNTEREENLPPAARRLHADGDFLAESGYTTLSIVIQMPRAWLGVGMKVRGLAVR